MANRATYYCYNNNSAALHAIFNRQLACNATSDGVVLRRLSTYCAQLSDACFAAPFTPRAFSACYASLNPKVRRDVLRGHGINQSSAKIPTPVV